MALKMLKRAGQLILIPAACCLLVLILMALVYLLPTGGMKEHVRNTLGNFEKEGTYFYSLTGEAGADHENFVDALYLDQAIVGTEEADLLTCVLKGQDYVYRDLADPIGNLTAAVTNPESVTVTDTELRFFNGHLVFVKPLLTVMGYTGIRTFCFYFCLAATALTGFLMYRRGLEKYILPLMISILFLRPVTVWTNMSFTGIYACMVIPCIVMLLIRKETLKKKAWLFFGITGSATFCFNMNYFQLVCFGVPMLMYLLIEGIPEKPTELLKTGADLFIAWMTGYAGVMVCKWAVYAVCLDGSIFSEMLEHVLWRSGVDEGSRMETILYNARIAFGSLWWDLTEMCFAGWSLVRLCRRRKKNGKAGRRQAILSGTELLLLLAAVLFPLGRLAILANHSMHHAGFVYRVFMIPVLAVNLLIAKKCNESR